jgi:antitoxin HicB
MTIRYAYPVILEPEADSDGITAMFNGLPGATWGATKAEALTLAEDLLVTALSVYTDDDKPLPRPAPARGRPVVSVPPLVAAKLALHDAMLSAGVSNVELGRRIGSDEKSVRRLRDPLHRSHIGAIETALRALGQRLAVETEPASV